MSCIECGEAFKYKCPTCIEPYCSVNCYKKHKEKPCSAPSVPPKETDISYESTIDYVYPTTDTVPLEKLKLLEHSTDLRKCLNNPHLRDILELLDKSPYPDKMIQKYMQEPIFTEFVDACLEVVQTKE